ncbi:MAG: hypothetical protein AAB683_00340 [Patescibacteria group bacterium]
MPKRNTILKEKNKDIGTKEIILDDEEKVIDPDIVSADALAEEEEKDEDELGLDDDELDPFKDKWEE